ncbi:MAG: PDZ domain-containing protein [Candidatus Omnitrophica bacterium]|nr:PDZ domain-containing protein [Candidatus Omnitrophota bacterium]
MKFIALQFFRVNINRIIGMFLVCLFAMTMCSAASFADTIYLKNDETLKGVVVEEYKDRIVLSTITGEIEVMRNEIEQLIYDREEQNLVSLAEHCQDRGEFIKAYYYYNRALTINPDYKKARKGLNYVGIYVVNTGRKRKLDHVERLNAGERERQGQAKGENKEKREKVKDVLGLSLSDDDGNVIISGVVTGSPASKSGVKKGDTLLSLWARSVNYMEPEDIMDKLLSPVMDVQMTIKRSYKLNLKNASIKYGNLAGIKFGYSEMEGMIVKGVVESSPSKIAGIKKDDIISTIGGRDVRYMGIKEADKIINSSSDGHIVISVKRDVIIWKNFAKNGGING